MLAWAVTIHKAQGLTLPKAVVNAGEDEKSSGLLFVAMARVRHLSTIVFSPWPGVDRFTTCISKKPALKHRKKHEEHLRALAHKTAQRYNLPTPALPRKQAQTTAPKGASPWQHSSVGRQQAPPSKRASSGQPSKVGQKKKALSQPHTTSANPNLNPNRNSYANTNSEPKATSRKRPLTLDALDEQDAVDATSLARISCSHFSSIGLPHRDEPLALQNAVRPEWLREGLANLGLVLEARIIDFWAGGRAANCHVKHYLEFLGFQVS